VAPICVRAGCRRSRSRRFATRISRNEVGTAVFQSECATIRASSVGISVWSRCSTRNTSTPDARLASTSRPSGDGLAASARPVAPDATRLAGRLNAAVNPPGAMLAYNNDFLPDAWCCRCAPCRWFSCCGPAQREASFPAGGGGMNARPQAAPSPHLVRACCCRLALPGRTPSPRATGHPGLSHRPLPQSLGGDGEPAQRPALGRTLAPADRSAGDAKRVHHCAPGSAPESRRCAGSPSPPSD